MRVHRLSISPLRLAIRLTASSTYRTAEHPAKRFEPVPGPATHTQLLSGLAKCECCKEAMRIIGAQGCSRFCLPVREIGGMPSHTLPMH